MSVKILHCADLHLGSPFVRLPKEQRALRQHEQKEVFWELIELCKERQADLLLIAGDLFDCKDVSSDLLHDVVRGFSSLSKTQVFIAAGNHDPLEADSVYRSGMFGENVHIFSGHPEDIMIESLGVHVWGTSFCSETQTKSFLEAFPEMPSEDLNIGVLHGDYPAVSSNYDPLTKTQIQESGLDYLALGHIHGYSGILSAGQTYYAYSGTTLGRGFDETGPKGVLFGEVGKGKCDLEFIPVGRREYRIHTLDISEIHSDLELVQQIQAQYARQHFYRFFLEGRRVCGYRPNPGMLRHILEEKGYQIDMISDRSRAGYNLEQIAAENNLRGVFVQQMTQKIKAVKEDEAEKYRKALELGLEAFDGEVDYIENH